MKYGREMLAVAQRILIELVRRRRSLIFWSIFPIVVLLLNGYMVTEWAKLPLEEAFAQATPSSLVGAALFFSCLGGSVSTVVGEREQQTLKRLFISPLNGTSYFFGIFLAHALIGFGQALLMYTLAIALGAEFAGSPFLMVWIILLSIMSYVGVGFVLGTQFARRTEDVNALVAAFGVPLLILGGAFFPSQFMPDLLDQWAAINPVFHMIEALNGASLEKNPLADQFVSFHITFLFAFAVAMVLAGWLSYRRMVVVERRL